MNSPLPRLLVLAAVSSACASAGCSLLLGIDEPQAAFEPDGGDDPDADTSPDAGPDAATMATITVTLAGNGTGSVTSDPPGLTCPGTCALTVAIGTQVTLSTTVVNDEFTGYGGACTGTTCVLPGTADASVTARFFLPANIVFVTSTKQAPGSLLGLAGADALCNSLAGAAGLPGSYVAWLSNSTTDARNRLTNNQGWVRPDGERYANTIADILLGKVRYPPRLDEHGVSVSDLLTMESGAVTATRPDGNRQGGAATYCQNYTDVNDPMFVTAGVPASDIADWTDGFPAVGCDDPTRLYCFGVERGDLPLAFAIPPDQMTTFITSATWTPGGGLASADALCESEGSIHPQTMGLNDFKAMLSTDAESAGDRFASKIIPNASVSWIRPDGVPVGASIADLFDGGSLVAPINVTLDHVHLDADVWSGGPTIDSATPGQTCNNWTSTGGNGVILPAASALDRSGSVQSLPCSTPLRLRCLAYVHAK